MVLCFIVSESFQTEDIKVPVGILTRFFVFVGQVALRQLIHLDTYVFSELKRRNYLKEEMETEKKKKKKKRNTRKSLATSATEASMNRGVSSTLSSNLFPLFFHLIKYLFVCWFYIYMCVCVVFFSFNMVFWSALLYHIFENFHQLPVFCLFPGIPRWRHWRGDGPDRGCGRRHGGRIHPLHLRDRDY